MGLFNRNAIAKPRINGVVREQMRLSARWMKYYHLDDANTFLQDLEWLLSTMAKNSFKRLQLPPLLSVHKRTLANTREAQMREDRYVFEELKQKILNG